jgi:hypothetical protein
MIKEISKKTFTLLILTLSYSVGLSAENIKLVDESNSTKLTQTKIVGCGENPSIEQQNRDLDEIKKQLAFILKKLSELENKKDSEQKRKDISNIKNCLSKITKEKNSKEKKVKKKKKKPDYIVVTVKRGDRLSDYAKKYYGDKRKYYRIYKANRDKIAEDYQLIVGDKIIIPLSPHYKYKKFKKIKHVRRKKPKKKIIKHKTPPKKEIEITNNSNIDNSMISNEEIIIQDNSLDKYPMAKIFTTKKKDKLDMLEEPVFVDDERIDTKKVIPLDDN